MTPDDLDRVLAIFTSQRPFRPYIIELMTGVLLAVSHPEAVCRIEGFYYFVGSDGVPRFFGAGSVCEVYWLSRSA